MVNKKVLDLMKIMVHSKNGSTIRKIDPNVLKLVIQKEERKYTLTLQLFGNSLNPKEYHTSTSNKNQLQKEKDLNNVQSIDRLFTSNQPEKLIIWVDCDKKSFLKIENTEDSFEVVLNIAMDDVYVKKFEQLLC